MTGLAVQAGGGDVAGPIMTARGEQDEVTGESLVLPHHDDVPHLTKRDSHITHPAMTLTFIINDERFT